MTILSDLLVGKNITKIQSFDDYQSISLNDGGTLNIYNRHTIDDEVSDHPFPREILNVAEDGNYIKITLDPRGIIKVGMRDIDFQGPEAMSYRGDNGQSIIWP